MVADFAVHQPDREDGGLRNPHFHVLCPIRPISAGRPLGQQAAPGNICWTSTASRIRDEAGNDVFNAVPTTDWGSPDTLEHWRQAWAELCNAKFAEKGLGLPHRPPQL